MSDNDNSPVIGQPGADEPDVRDERDDHDPDKAQRTIEKLRAEKREARTESSAMKDQVAELTRKLAAIEQAYTSKLTEMESKLTTELETRKHAELNAARLAAASKYKLPEAFASRIQGTTKDEIEADAAALAEALPKPPAG